MTQSHPELVSGSGFRNKFGMTNALLLNNKNMTNIDKKFWLILLSGFFLILFLMVVIFNNQKTGNNSVLKSTTTVLPTVTLIPGAFTGVKEETFPKEIIDATSQKKDLRNKTPLTTANFIINFDYSSDKFTVILKEPKNESKTQFNNWLTKNYPNLIISQFIFK